MTEAALPVPQLELVAHVTVKLEPPQSTGQGPWGERRQVRIVGGAFAGPRMRGVVLDGGADWQVVHASGMITVDTHYGLRTDDGALIYISTRGVRVASPDVAARLSRGDPVAPTDYYFRVVATLETGAQMYYWLNERIFVASAARHLDDVVYDLYAIS